MGWCSPSEFQRTDDGQQTQDCEVKAFYRVARKRESCRNGGICLVAEGVYAGQPSFEVCQDVGWKDLIVLRAEGD